MEFEWGSAKAEANLRKHCVSFEEAAQVFLDPQRIETIDDRENYGEAGRLWAWSNPLYWPSSIRFAAERAISSD
jgi:uncharacterized DUF497 family protein